ncbi:uncharacterized protein K02A2.6-like [Aedes albopictus]|uniref:RNA-directed DNA polymerase n=1 Tax=Aedes albopictus TaxID=7160 RepID=A0ABM1Z7U5_AEDAL
MENKPSLPQFDVSDTSSIGTRWTKWKRSLELFLDVNCIALASRKKSYLLHFAGSDVQDIFYEIEGHNAAPPAGSDVYKETIRLLDAYFAPMASIPYDRYVFRSMKQEDESVEKFVGRLREQGRLCDYGGALDMRITEQVFDNCRSDELREIILKKKLLTVPAIVEEARILETVKRNKEEMKKLSTPLDEPQAYQVKRERKKEVCFRCGNSGHFANDRGCPAKNRICDKCNLIGHFRKMCKTKLDGKQIAAKKKKNRVLQVRESDDDDDLTNGSADEPVESDSDSDVQQICATGTEHDKVTCYIGGVKQNWIVDSGAHVNVVSRGTWRILKHQGCKISCSSESRKFLRVYGNGKLKIHKVIRADISTRSKTVHHDVYVVDNEKGANLLCKQTSMDLGILKIEGEVFNVAKKEEPPIGKVKGLQVDVKIDEKVVPVQQPARRLPIPLEELVESKLQDLLKQDIIEPAPLRITWASPLVVTPKDGGRSVRLCVDMRRANEAIIPERHPLPTFDEIMPHLDGCKYFSKIDLVKAFHQIELAPSSREITTFVTPNAYYRYKRLMFGMNCAAEIFQREIERILKGLKGIKVFVDDILVFAKTQEEHDRRVQAVLRRLKEYEITVNMDKSEIGKKAVDFMGHTLSAKGISPMNNKVSAIQTFRRPSNVAEMRSFLGLVNYVGKFIPNLSSLSAPLRQMTVKGAPFCWTREEKRSFEAIKSALVEPEHLGYFSPKNPTTLITNASDNGLGAVLLQHQQGKTKVISYASKSLTKAEKKYSTLDKEALAIAWATERFRMYLTGLHFTIMTDHKPLVSIFSLTSIPNQRQERWVLKMQAYRYKIEYVPGRINIADPLSRLSEVLDKKSFDRSSEADLCAVVEVNKPAAITMSEIIQRSQEDEELQGVKTALHNGEWEGVLKKYAPFKSELCFANEILLRKNRIVVPQDLREVILTLAHIGHPGREKMKRRLRVAVWWPGIDAAVEKVCKECFSCQLVAPFEKPEPLRIRDLPSAPWIHLAGDFLGPLPDGTYLFMLIDLYSRYVLAEPMKYTTSKEVIRFLNESFTRMGLPYILTFDNARNFSSQELKDYCVDRGIKLTHTTPYYPSANGEIERQNRSVLKVLKISKQQGTIWKEALQDYLYMYSVTPHSVTGVSPAQLMFGRRFRDLIPHMQMELCDDEELRDRDRIVKHNAKECRDRRVGAKESQIEVGDEVLLKNMTPQNKLSSNFLSTAAKVIHRNGNSLTLETENGQVYKRNTSHVKPLVRPAEGKQQRLAEKSDDNEVVEPVEDPVSSQVSDTLQRPRREVRRPKHLDDFRL